MSTKELIWGANGEQPIMLESLTVSELVIFDLASRNQSGQASFNDSVNEDNYAEELAFQRDGTPRRY